LGARTSGSGSIRTGVQGSNRGATVAAGEFVGGAGVSRGWSECSDAGALACGRVGQWIWSGHEGLKEWQIQRWTASCAVAVGKELSGIAVLLKKHVKPGDDGQRRRRRDNCVAVAIGVTKLKAISGIPGATARATPSRRRGIASPEMLPSVGLLPHVICSPPVFGGGGHEADRHETCRR
jgi:hypothetical protein